MADSERAESYRYDGADRHVATTKATTVRYPRGALDRTWPAVRDTARGATVGCCDCEVKPLAANAEAASIGFAAGAVTTAACSKSPAPRNVCVTVGIFAGSATEKAIERPLKAGGRGTGRFFRYWGRVYRNAKNCERQRGRTYCGPGANGHDYTKGH